jgi:spermidine synthase
MRVSNRSALLMFVLFFVSGATGLVYEVAWTRMFTAVFGNTVHAASTVLAAYMGGLALGSLLLGRRGDRFDRPLVAYGALELAIGLYALAVPLLVGGLTGLYSSIFQAFGQRPLPVTIVRFVLSFIVLLVPTTLMGATLPILSKMAGREFAGLGRGVGALYALNTFGAVFGSFLTGFILLEAVGVSNSVYIAAAVGIGVGLVALGAGWRLPRVESELPGRPAGQPAGDIDVRAAAPEPGAGRGKLETAAPVDQAADGLSRYSSLLILLVYAVSGAAALGYEVLYTRVLVFSLGATAHAFSVMLTTFLVGIAIGSAVSSRLVDRSRRPIEAFAIIEILIGASVLASIYLLRELGLTHQYLAIRDAGGDLFRLRGADFLQSAMVMLVPTLLMGAAFPVVARIYARRNLVAASVGNIYFFNTVGAVAGSLLAGFVLVPVLGSARSIAVLAAVNVALGVLLFSCVGRRRVWITSAAVALAALLVAAFLIRPAVFAETFNIRQPGSELIYAREGVSGTVTVHRFPSYDLIAVDGLDVAGTSPMLRVTQKLQGHLPVLLAADTQRIAHIGFGSGETLRVLNLHHVGTIDGIEICKDVISAARRFFGAINLNVFDRPNVHITIMDGKNYVLLTRQKYDIIMTDSIYPGSSGASALYTVDHFKEVWEKLNPGGIASCWLPLDLAKTDLASALMAFNRAFPDMTVWYCYMNFSQHALLIGRKGGPVMIDAAKFAAAFADPGLREDLAGILVDDPLSLISCLLADGEAVRKFCAGVPANTDDRPSLEFGVARRGMSRRSLSANLTEMLALRPNPLPYLANMPVGPDSAAAVGEVLKRFQVSSLIIAGHAHNADSETGLAKAEYAKALTLDPENRIALASISDLDRVVSTLEQAAAEGNQDYDVIYGLGVRYLAEGRFEEAVAKLQQALNLRPDSPDPHVSLGECYLRWGKLEDALRHFNDADRIRPNEAGIAFRIGTVLDQLGRKAEAEQAYLKAIRLGPDSFEARNNLGRLYLGAGNIAEARIHFEEAVRIAPARPEAVYNLGLAYARESKWNEAAEQYRKALRLAPTFYQAHLGLGDALLQLGDTRGAVEEWQRTLRIKPDHEGAKQRLKAARP